MVSSGLHGVEGHFGSAVQQALLASWGARPSFAARGLGSGRCVLVHALNPYGFAWSRRVDVANVDPNRNFLRPGEDYRGQSPAYAAFNDLLNPTRPPSTVSLFPVRMLIALAVHGRARLKQAIVSGQYDFPRGLFFGGSAPSPTTACVERGIAAWTGAARLILHLDLHSGLGPFASHKLLVDEAMPSADRERLSRWFGASTVEAGDPAATSYRARGAFPYWCADLTTARRRYLHACAEFGTYGNLRVLAALRAENQAHHWTEAGDRHRARAKARLREAFCPASPRWRTRVLTDAVALVERGIAGLMQEPLP